MAPICCNVSLHVSYFLLYVSPAIVESFDWIKIMSIEYILMIHDPHPTDGVLPKLTASHEKCSRRGEVEVEAHVESTNGSS